MGMSSTWHMQQLHCQPWAADTCESATSTAISGPETAGSVWALHLLCLWIERGQAVRRWIQQCLVSTEGEWTTVAELSPA